MKRLKIAAIIMTLFIITGCELQSQPVATDSGNIGQSQTQPAKSVETVKLEDTATKKDQTKDKGDSAKTPQPTPSVKPTPENTPKPPKIRGDKINFQAIDKLDNTRLSWWITLNSQHKTPGIPDNARKLISKYDGIYIGDTSKKVVYLTFDEGYENGYTPKILDTLKANNVKALFFITGPYLKEKSDLVKRMLDEGHLVGNHSINHPGLPSVSDEVLENELLGLEKQFKAKFGKGFDYMRPPRGEYSERVLAAAQQLGYKTVFWSFAYKDYEVNNQKGKEHAYKMVMNNLHNGAVLLLHAVSKDNAEALDSIIKDIKKQGYEIRAFDL